MQPPSEADAAVKPEAAATAADANGKGFAWTVCTDSDLYTRVCIKQQAVDDALRHALKISKELRAPTGGEPSSDPETLRSRCGRELVEWMAEIDKVHEASQAFEVLIGVAGRTGAGKSTILNMLLEIPELLPSSNSEAATSCACRVSWNDSDDPDYLFRAEVVFRSREDVAQELRSIFAQVQKRNSLAENDAEDDDPFDRMEEEAELQSAIAEGFNKISAIWGLDEQAAEGMSVEELLASNSDVLHLLGATKTIHSRDAEQFAEHVKPYLDSSENLQGFRAWPLITEVRIFVKAPFLKNGVVLVDLPGLSDAVESRAQVANRYTQKLEITAIVTPARRAIDEKTGVQLMSDYQTLRMQLDGKYHKKSFCVVVSQVDEIDPDVFIKGDELAKKDQDLLKATAKIKTLTKRSAMLSTEVKNEIAVLDRLEDKFTKADTKCSALKPNKKTSISQANQNRFEKAKEDRRKAMQERNKQKKHVKTASQNKANNDQQLAALLTRQKWACVWMRNRHIKKAIRRDFAQRQKILARERRHRNEYDGSVDVIPVSATAFRDHLKDREPPGFPTVRHTGIPLLRRWLADSTLERREKHLDALLHALQRLFSSIQQWSLTNCGGQAIQFSRETVQDLLSRTHTKLVTDLEMELMRGSQAVKTLDPFKQIDQGREVCKREASKAATRWAVRAPENKASSVLMHWVTFNAILNRKGGPYYSKGREKREYNFPEAMVVSLLATVLEGWHRVFRVEIPSAEIPIMKGIENIWQQYLDELKDQVQTTAPDIIPQFEESMQTIRGIMAEMRDKVHAALAALSECSSEVHPEFLSSLRTQLLPIFEEALKYKGNGHFQQRRRHLYNSVKQASDAMFEAGTQKMQRKYRDNVAKLPKIFSGMAAFAGAKVMAQITLLLDRLQGASGKDWAVADMQESLQMRLQTAIVEWQMDWRLPKMDGGALRREDVEIPREFVEESKPIMKEETKEETKEGTKKEAKEETREEMKEGTSGYGEGGEPMVED